MLFKVVFCALFSCVLSAAPYPNILEVRSCYLTLNGRNITFVNSFVQAKDREDVIYFSACKDLMQVGCDKKALACIKKNNKFINLLEEKESSAESFIVRSKEDCADRKYEIEIRTSFTPDKYKLERRGPCKYILEINPGLTENCTKAVNDRRLLFKHLSKDISIKSGDETIILNLCGPPADCEDPNSAMCSRNETSKSISPLGRVSTERINDDGDNVEFHYKTVAANRKHEKITSVILKCNWTTVLGNTSFRRVSSKKLEIIIETSAACVKRMRSCLVMDRDNYLHDLSGLSRADGWNLTADNGSATTVKLNVCGPLESDRLCSDQRTQVCRSGGRPANYGTAMSPITVENDVIKFSFKDGSQCSKNPNVNLMSSFELHCSFEEEGPKLVKENDCGLEISWRTPSACPISNENIVDYKVTKEYDGKPCTVEDGDLMYNLTQLSMKRSNYIVKSNELEFLLNVCKPLGNVNNSFCRSSMGMCVKNNSEPNIKKMFFSIGNVQSPIVQNGQLMLKYARGFICKKSMRDASAIIYFNCSEEESHITFLKEKDCVYEFNWKTKYACPNKIDCAFWDTSGNVINLEEIKATNFQFKNGGVTYTIDVCRNQFTIDDGVEETRDVKVTKDVFDNKEKTFLEYRLDKSCRDAGDFNIVRIYLDCDVLLNNQHYEFGNISHCTVHLKFRHNSFCRGTTVDTPPEVTVRNVEEKEPRNFYETHEDDDNVKNCIVRFGDEEINLNAFAPIKVKGYTIGINKTSCCCRHFICREEKAVATLSECPKAVSEDDQLKLIFDGSEIVFFCKTEQARPEVVSEELNSVSFRYPLENLCRESGGGSGPVIGGIVSCVFVILLCGLGLYNKQFLVNKCGGNRKSQLYVYCKNSED